VRIERRDGWWLWVGGPVPRGASAITLGRLVSVRRGRAASERLIRHELVHVEQYRRLGVVGFLCRYLAAYARWRLRGYGHRGAYRRIPLEASAEWRARRSLGLGVVAISPGRVEHAPPDDAAGDRAAAAGDGAAARRAGEPSPL
jgi:hypothetical protein